MESDIADTLWTLPYWIRTGISMGCMSSKVSQRTQCLLQRLQVARKYSTYPFPGEFPSILVAARLGSRHWLAIIGATVGNAT